MIDVFQVIIISDKKHKSIKDIQGYENHALRKQETPNANLEIENQILIGSTDIVGDVQRYIAPVKTVRKNNVLAREILLSASPEWFEQATQEEKERWVLKNVDWLKENFGDNIVFSILHQDEKTLHISSLLVPRFYDNGVYHLANHLYFDGREKMYAWHDNYNKAMQEFNLRRGIRKSKATHVEIQRHYAKLKETFNENDYYQILAKAREYEIMKKQMKELKATLEVVDDDRSNLESFTSKLAAAYEKLEQQSEFYEKVIEGVSMKHNISEKEIMSMVSTSKEREHGERLN